MDVLASDARHILLYGGSRSGKSFLLCRAIMLRALRVPNTRHIIFRSTFSACKQSIGMETMPDVFRKCFPGISYDKYLNRTDWVISLENGSEIWFGGLETGDRLDKILGKEYSTIFCNEISQIPYLTIEQVRSRLAQKSDLKLKAYYDMNPTTKRHWSYIQFIEKKNPIDNQPLRDPTQFSCYRLNPADNLANIDSEYLNELGNASEKTRMRFLHGQFLDDSEGALWTVEGIAQQRRLATADKPLPEFVRVIVSVDPSGCSGPSDTRSDEVGIIVAALGSDMCIYILADLSGRYSPEDWGKVAVDAYEHWQADRVVAESNYGGDMVRAVIQAVNPTIPFESVSATRGKTVRAEPVSALYDQGKVCHVGHFPDLESQMCNMMVSGYTGIKSPDRADALVWAVTALSPKLSQIHAGKLKNHARPQVITPSYGASRFDRRL